MIPRLRTRKASRCPHLWVYLWLLCVGVFGSTATIQAQEIAGDSYYDPDAASCPRRVIFYLESGSTEEKYVGYANRGVDAFFSPVFYTFSNVKSASGRHTASGNFYIYGIECRLATWLSWNGVMSPPPWRYEFVESETLACTGTGAQPIRPYTEVVYDPYSGGDIEDEENCGGSGGGGDSPGPGGSTCHSEWLVVERSDDGGATWYVIWEGWGTVCE